MNNNYSINNQPSFKSYNFESFAELAEKLPKPSGKKLLEHVDRFVKNNSGDKNYNMTVKYHPSKDAISMITEDVKKQNFFKEAFRIKNFTEEAINKIMSNLQNESQFFRSIDSLPKGTTLEGNISDYVRFNDDKDIQFIENFNELV